MSLNFPVTSLCKAGSSENATWFSCRCKKDAGMSNFLILDTLSRPRVIFAAMICFLYKDSWRNVTFSISLIRPLALITSVDGP